MRLEPNHSGSEKPCFATCTLSGCPVKPWEGLEQERGTLRIRKPPLNNEWCWKPSEAVGREREVSWTRPWALA